MKIEATVELTIQLPATNEEIVDQILAKLRPEMIKQLNPMYQEKKQFEEYCRWYQERREAS